MMALLMLIVIPTQATTDCACGVHDGVRKLKQALGGLGIFPFSRGYWQPQMTETQERQWQAIQPKDDQRIHPKGCLYTKGNLETKILDIGKLGKLWKTSENCGQTALHRATDADYVELVEWLLNAGANPDVRDDKGWTALHYAAWNVNVQTMRLLLRNGATPNVRLADGGGRLMDDLSYMDGHGKTPLHLLIYRCLQGRQGYIAPALELLKAGAISQTPAFIPGLETRLTPAQFLRRNLSERDLTNEGNLIKNRLLFLLEATPEQTWRRPDMAVAEQLALRSEDISAVPNDVVPNITDFLFRGDATAQ